MLAPGLQALLEISPTCVSNPRCPLSLRDLASQATQAPLLCRTLWEGVLVGYSPGSNKSRKNAAMTGDRRYLSVMAC